MRKPSKSSSRPLSDAKLAELKRNASGILADLRRELIKRSPFIGSIAMNLNVIPTRDIRCATACTDGTNIYFDIDFMSGLLVEEQLFVLAHEVWHNVMLHFVRRENRDSELFNQATDLEVNQILKKDGFAVCKDALMPTMMCLPVDLSAEEYYELLLDRQSSASSKSSGNDGSSNGSKSGSTTSNGKPSGQFDKHIYKDEKLESAEGEIDDKYGKVGEDPDFAPDVNERAVEQIREAAVSAAQEMERSRGEIPGHIKKLINDMLSPKVNWKDVLAQFITRAEGLKTTWSRPNRRHVWNKTYLPSTYGEKLKIAVGIDTSGSVMQDLPRFLGELNGLVKSFGSYELHLMQCDTQVEDYQLFDEDHPLDLEQEHFEVKGLGGTSLHPIFSYVEDNNIDVDAVVIFTDGCCEEFPESDAPEYPVLWMISQGGSKNSIHFGEVSDFE